MKSFIKPLVLIFSFSALSTGYTQAQGRHAAAHVHGVNQLQMVHDNNQLLVIYRMPLGQLEEANASHHDHDEDHHAHGEDHHDHEEDHHAHGEESDHATSHETEDRLEAFKDYDQLFSASEIATQCTLTDFNVELHSVVADKDDPHAGHKDAILEYQFNCRQGLTLSAVDINAFNLFEDLERVDFEGLLDGVGVTVSTFPDAPRVAF
jgi:hypothetical protein